ncbi:MAG: hypothetical protein ABI972_05890 [Acidobacteriota bacterium]
MNRKANMPQGEDKTRNAGDPRAAAALRAQLAALPRHEPPSQLRSQLRVMGSQEAQKRRMWSSPTSVAAYVLGRLGLIVNNMMRPYALPVTGGLLSAVVLFSVVLTSYPMIGEIQRDVPTPVSTEPGVVSSFAFGLGDEDIVVDVSTDDQGRFMEYSLPSGQRWATDPEIRRSLENMLLCTRFRPSTRFGQPSSGKTRIIILRSSMDVRG